MRGVVNSDISWRFNLNRKSTLNLGLFGGVDGFRNGGGSYRQGYSSSQDPLHYYIEAIYDDEDENESEREGTEPSEILYFAVVMSF